MLDPLMSQVAADSPAEVIRHWLTEDWKGPLRPLRVEAVHAEDAEDRESWFFYLVLPSPSGETWDPGEFAALQRAIRDKALEVGLSYPWYVIPRPDEEESELEDDAEPVAE